MITKDDIIKTASGADGKVIKLFDNIRYPVYQNINNGASKIFKINIEDYYIIEKDKSYSLYLKELITNDNIDVLKNNFYIKEDIGELEIFLSTQNIEKVLDL